jgi:hypothetical protein
MRHAVDQRLDVERERAVGEGKFQAALETVVAEKAEDGGVALA